MEPNSLAAIPGMGIPDQLKAAMEQEASGEDTHVHTLTLLKQIFVSSKSKRWFGGGV